MEDRKRTIIAILIALIVVLALLYSFGMNLFSRTPSLDMADPGAAESTSTGTAGPGENAGVQVQVAPETVQSMIASLSRYQSYFREISVTYTWGDSETAVLRAQVWETDGWCRTESVLDSGIIECSIVNGAQLWLWYSGGADISEAVYKGTAGEDMKDRMQYLPTYEDVLLLDQNYITDAEYVEYLGQPCIYVEAEQQELGYLYRYWISMDNGLLIAAETEKSGVPVYRMESGEVTSPLLQTDGLFTLPDGTVLYVAQ